MGDKVVFVIVVGTKNDPSGNPRRGYAGYCAEGGLVRFEGSGYRNRPDWTRNLPMTGRIDVTPSFYRALIMFEKIMAAAALQEQVEKRKECGHVYKDGSLCANLTPCRTHQKGKE